MKTLFIGGTGNISLPCTREATRRGIEVVHFNRGRTLPAGRADVELLEGVQTIRGDIRNAHEARSLLADHRFDCVVDWIAFTPEDIRRDVELFRDRTNQFIFISSASVYHKPPNHYVITESTPAFNPYWEYSRNKIACEMLLRQEYATDGFPSTIVRPSHTYSDGWFPTTFSSKDFTVPQRMVDGKSIVVHGDGQSLWTLTHSDDFAKGLAGLLGNPAAIGESFHITSDEALSWDQIHRTIGRALGVEPRIVHVPSDLIARLSPQIGPSLMGDKQYSLVFDNTKIKRIVPGYTATIPFYEGMCRSVEWIDTHPERKVVDAELDRLIDDIASAVEPTIR
ncbi:MAG: SDR family oxidoreductase [Spirochaetia bacterium]